MNELALFAGAGGGILGGILNGWRTVCAVEINDYCRRVLMQRQDDGCLEPFPIWDDITTFDGRPWAGCVDIVTGGFPCQDISAAGKGAGISGERSGLWSEMARIIGEVRPSYVLVENSPMLALRGLGTVLGDLAALGFDAEWGCLSAAATGAPHKRDRIWIVGYSMRSRCEADHRRESIPDIDRISTSHASKRDQLKQRTRGSGDVANADSARREWTGSAQPEEWDGSSIIAGASKGMANSNSNSIQGMVAKPQPRKYGRQTGLHSGEGIFQAWPEDPADAPESDVGRVVDGMARRVDRLKALGNGQVPRVVATAWETLR